MIFYESSYYGVLPMDLEAVEHHGIKGQKWGKRNGPPYPLNQAAHNKVVKKARTDKGRAASKPKQPTSKKKEPVFGASKPNSTPANDHDHSKSSHTSLAMEVVHTALSALRAGPAAPVVVLPMVAKKVADVTTASIKEKKAAKRSEKAELDTKTGLKKKDKEWSAEKDLKAVNPGFKNLNDNTKNNCMLCTATYDLRRRGFEVTAQKASYGYGYSDVQRWYPKAKNVAVDGRGANGKWNSKVAATKTKEALINQGDGARGNLMVQWKTKWDGSGGGGHSMAYEVKNGKVRVYDGQTGKTSSIDKIIARSSSATYARLDNVEPDWKKIKECCR